MQELLNLRQENTKTFDLTGGKRQLVVPMGAVHYKDNYADPKEQWKDIDLTWVGNRITKAPYELTLDGNKATIRDKKTGEVSTIELMSVSPAGIPFEVLPENGAVRFQHILPSDKIPFEARFKVTCKGLITRAYDNEGELVLDASLVDGVLTEKLSEVRDKQTGKIRPAKGNIVIDPTWQVGASTDDCYSWGKTGVGWYISLDSSEQVAGWTSSSLPQHGGGMRFLNVTIPQGAIIDSAYLTLRARSSKAGVTVKSVIIGEAVDNAATFSTIADFQARRGTVVEGANDNNITTAFMYWDAIPAWTQDVDYNSPTTDGVRTFASIIQEIIDRVGWVSGNALVIFWDDFNKRSTASANCYRAGYSYNGSTTYAPKLVITYFAWTGKISGVTNPAKIMGVTNIAKVKGVVSA